MIHIFYMLAQNVWKNVQSPICFYIHKWSAQNSFSLYSVNAASNRLLQLGMGERECAFKVQ